MVACPAVMDLMNEGTGKKSPVLYFHCFCCFHNITQGITYSSSLPAREYPTIRRASSRPSTDHRNPRRWPKEFVSPSGSTCTAAPSVSQTSIVYLVRIPVGIRRTWFNRNERIAQSTRPKRPISPDRCIGIASINDSLEHCSRPLTSAGAAAASLVHISMVMDRAQQEDDMEMTSSRLGINSYRRRGSSRAPLLRRDPSTAPDDCRCRLRPSRWSFFSIRPLLLLSLATLPVFTFFFWCRRLRRRLIAHFPGLTLPPLIRLLVSLGCRCCC